jgi:hypothetical protein
MSGNVNRTGSLPHLIFQRAGHDGPAVHCSQTYPPLIPRLPSFDGECARRGSGVANRVTVSRSVRTVSRRTEIDAGRALVAEGCGEGVRIAGGRAAFAVAAPAADRSSRRRTVRAASSPGSDSTIRR